LDLANVAEFADQSGDILDPGDPICLCPSVKGVRHFLARSASNSEERLESVGFAGFFDSAFQP
jgi:hypothetical protein